MPAVAAISAAKDMAYVNLHQVVRLHIKSASYDLPIRNTDGYAQFDIYKLCDVDAQRSRNGPDAEQFGNALHDTPCKSSKERERHEHCKRSSEPENGPSAYIETNAEDAADRDHLVYVSTFDAHQLYHSIDLRRYVFLQGVDCGGVSMVHHTLITEAYLTALSRLRSMTSSSSGKAEGICSAASASSIVSIFPLVLDRPLLTSESR
jgi:hypothetical protein